MPPVPPRQHVQFWSLGLWPLMTVTNYGLSPRFSELLVFSYSDHSECHCTFPWLTTSRHCLSTVNNAKENVKSIIVLTWEPTAGKVTPCSLRFLIIAEMRLSWGSFLKSSAHSTMRALSFSHTFG